MNKESGKLVDFINDPSEIKVSIVRARFNSVITEKMAINSEKRLKQIEEVIDENKSDLLIFAENEYPYLITDLADLNFITNNLQNNQSIIMGGTKKENSKFFNTLILLEKNKIQYFNKKILVPFGEFLPFRNLLYFLEEIVGNNDFSAGDNTRLLKTSGNFNILPIICYEIIFLNDLLNTKNIESELLINITNDAWFGDLSGPYQHFYLSRMRTVELNKPLIRVSNNGISAVIDNYGKIINYIPLNKSAIMNLKISVPHSLPNLKNYHSLILVFFFVLFVVAILINRRFND